MKKDELLREIEQVYQHSDSLKKLVLEHDEIIIIGNGASNAIASHMAVDYTKQLKKKATAFSDGARLTCYMNDYGVEHAYAQFIEEFATPEKTLVILISSSGNSPNIVQAGNLCNNKGISWVALSGKNKNNWLNTVTGEYKKLNVWVNSQDYGVVECVHQILLHSIMEVK